MSIIAVLAIEHRLLGFGDTYTSSIVLLLLQAQTQVSALCVFESTSSSAA